jgi:hypothetical protein
MTKRSFLVNFLCTVPVLKITEKSLLKTSSKRKTTKAFQPSESLIRAPPNFDLKKC